MSLFYSASRAGFFDDRIHLDLPSDAQPITTKQHADLLAAQSAGSRIEPDENGRPIARKTIIEIDTRRALAIGEVKFEARRRILALATLEQQTNDNAVIAQAALGSTGIDVKVDPAALAKALARRAAIDAIRSASDPLEAEISTMNTRTLSAFDVTTNANWPA